VTGAVRPALDAELDASTRSRRTPAWPSLLGSTCTARRSPTTRLTQPPAKSRPAASRRPTGSRCAGSCAAGPARRSRPRSRRRPAGASWSRSSSAPVRRCSWPSRPTPARHAARSDGRRPSRTSIRSWLRSTATSRRSPASSPAAGHQCTTTALAPQSRARSWPNSVTRAASQPRARPYGWPASTSPSTSPTPSVAPGASPAKARRCCAGPPSRPPNRRASRPRPTAHYLELKQRVGANRAVLSVARKLLRRAHHTLRELGDEAHAAVGHQFVGSWPRSSLARGEAHAAGAVAGQAAGASATRSGPEGMSDRAAQSGSSLSTILSPRPCPGASTEIALGTHAPRPAAPRPRNRRPRSAQSTTSLITERTIPGVTGRSCSVGKKASRPTPTRRSPMIARARRSFPSGVEHDQGLSAWNGSLVIRAVSAAQRLTAGSRVYAPPRWQRPPKRQPWKRQSGRGSRRHRTSKAAAIQTEPPHS
jgi:hypothetical protein